MFVQNFVQLVTFGCASEFIQRVRLIRTSGRMRLHRKSELRELVHGAAYLSKQAMVRKTLHAVRRDVISFTIGQAFVKATKCRPVFLRDLSQPFDEGRDLGRAHGNVASLAPGIRREVRCFREYVKRLAFPPVLWTGSVIPLLFDAMPISVIRRHEAQGLEGFAICGQTGHCVVFKKGNVINYSGEKPGLTTFRRTDVSSNKPGGYIRFAGALGCCARLIANAGAYFENNCDS